MNDTTRFLDPDAVLRDDPVLRDATREVRAAEFVQEVHRRARTLEGTGAGPGTLWGWVGTPTVHGVLELHAILETGATVAPLNPALGEEGLAAAGARLPLQGLSTIRGDLVRRTPAETPPDPTRVAELLGAAADPAALIWTSGSTGAPRAILLTESAIRWHTRMVEARLALRTTDAWSATLSPAHVGGLLLLLRASILGSSVDATGGFAVDTLLRGIEERGVTHASLVPTMLRRLLDRLDGRTPDGALRAVLVGGAHAPPELLFAAASAGIPVAATWGMSEMTSQVTTATPEETARHPARVGAPLNGLDVRVASDGELLVRGPTLAGGRFTVSETAIRGEPLLVDGWFPTGDLGEIDARGTVRVTGRKGLRIISGGVNVDPLDVESALRTLDGVGDALVVGLADREWGERVCALIVESPPVDAPARRPEVVERARTRLAGAKLPRLVVSVPALPVNANGKPDRLRARIILDAHERDPIV